MYKVNRKGKPDNVSLEYSSREKIFVRGRYIEVHEDTLRVHLNDHLKQLEKKSRWITPFGMLITIGTTLITSEFHDYILNGNTWRKIFLFAGVFSSLWLIYSLLDARKSESIDDMIDSLICRNQK